MVSIIVDNRLLDLVEITIENYIRIYWEYTKDFSVRYCALARTDLFFVKQGFVNKLCVIDLGILK